MKNIDKQKETKKIYNKFLEKINRLSLEAEEELDQLKRGAS